MIFLSLLNNKTLSGQLEIIMLILSVQALCIQDSSDLNTANPYFCFAV